MNKFKALMEGQAFGVCSWLGDRMDIDPNAIRKFFIYTSFLTMGSPVIIYMSLAFLMDMRKHVRRSSAIWDW